MAKVKRPKTKNVLDFLLDEYNAGNTLISPDGEVLSESLFESDTRSEYAAEISSGAVDMETVTYTMFRDKKKESYLEVKTFLTMFNVDFNEKEN